MILYITFRYARNILAGIGFVYNPGEHVLGTTTPLYTFLLTISGYFSGGTQAPFPHIALYLNAIADAITCLLLLQIGRKLGSPIAGFGAALVWAIAPFSVTFAIGGLETSFYVLLLTGTISAYIHQHYKLSAFLAALSLLTRPDALLLVGPLFLDRAIQVLVQARSLPGKNIFSKIRTILPVAEIMAVLAADITLVNICHFLFWQSYASLGDSKDPGLPSGTGGGVNSPHSTLWHPFSG